MKLGMKQVRTFSMVTSDSQVNSLILYVKNLLIKLVPLNYFIKNDF